ncbi:MAG: hypothetical protein K2N63_11340 [Lachnospiraceae bacterium]|nr:hypothetical protein [Lachnospiraceae bacterium]
MKKSLYLVLLLAGLSFLSLLVAVGIIRGGSSRVAITQEIVAGDQKAAAGITLSLASHLNGRLFWNTEYTIGDGGGIQSEFTFSSSRVSWGWEQWEAGIYIGTNSNVFDKKTSMAQTASGFALPKISADVVGRMEGMEYVETVRIGDYYEKYPLVFRVWGSSVQYDSYSKAVGYLTNFFHIPTSQDRMEVYVKKYSDDKYAQIRYLRGTKVYDSQSVEIADASTFGQDGLYYAYTLVNTETGECVDRGQNTGIFYCPYQREGFGLRLDLNEMKKVCDLPEGMVLLALALDEEENFLYLALEGKEGGSLFVYQLGKNNVLEEDRMPEEGMGWEEGIILREEIALGEMGETGSFCQMAVVDGGILLTWNDNSFSFVARKEGQHRLWCFGRFPETMGEYGSEGMKNPFPRENTCLFDGNRLVLAAFENWEDMTVRLVVHNEKGQLYDGRYQNSQDTEPGFAPGEGIVPQGARIWAPNSAWSMKKGDAIVTALKLEGKGAGN